MNKKSSLNPNSIFISFVGSNDPWSDRDPDRNDGPLLTAWKYTRASRTIILSTPALKPEDDFHDIRDKTEMVADLLRDKGVSVELVSQPMKDPTDHVALERFVRPVLIEYLGKIGDYEQIYIGSSSGTQQQGMFWMSIVQTGQLDAQLLQSFDPRYVKPPDPLVRKIDPQFIAWQQWLKAALEHLASGQFLPARNAILEVVERTVEPASTSILTAAADILDVLYHWQISDYRKSLELISSINQDILEVIDSGWYSRAKETLGLHSGTNHGASLADQIKYHMLSLYSSAERSYAIADYNSLIGSVWSIYESYANYVAVREYGHTIDPESRFWAEKLRLPSHKKVTTGAVITNFLEKQRSFSRLMDKTVHYNDQSGSQKTYVFRKGFIADKRNSIRIRRNSAAHMGHPVSKLFADKAMAGALVILRMVFKDADIKNYPCRLDNLGWLRELIHGKL